MDRVRVKGRSLAFAIYDVVDGEEPATRDLKLATLTDFSTAMEANLEADFPRAPSLFEQVIAVHPGDKAANTRIMDTPGLEPI